MPEYQKPVPADRSEAPSREEVWDLLAYVRDGYPRRSNDAPTDTLIDALIERGWLAVRVDEGGQDR